MHLKITDAPYFVKIPVHLKIPASLKISVRSKNPYLKISVHQKANRPEWCNLLESCKGIQGEPERIRNSRPRHDHRRRTGEPQRESNKEIFLLIYRYNRTKSKIFAKKLKKVWKFNFLPYLCSRNQTTNTPKGKKKIQVKQ